MSDVPTFDTTLSTWTNVTAAGNIPASRRGHTAGFEVDVGVEFRFETARTLSCLVVATPVTVGTNNRNDVYSLDSTSMVWTYQNVNGNPPEPRKEHQSVLVGSLMLVLFGSNNKREGLNDVNALDTRTWTWLTTYDNSPSRLSTGAIAGIVVGVLRSGDLGSNQSSDQWLAATATVDDTVNDRTPVRCVATGRAATGRAATGRAATERAATGPGMDGGNGMDGVIEKGGKNYFHVPS
ncbi:hypothetical protein BC938DRAFT_476733, partial [Jimgerdemannia flammicorona]